MKRTPCALAALFILGAAVSGFGVQRSTVADEPRWDASRLIRIWDVRGSRPLEDPYARAREPGERMIMAAPSPPDASALDLVASAGYSLIVSAPGPSIPAGDALVSLGPTRLQVAGQEVRARGLDWAYAPETGFPPPARRAGTPVTPIRCLEHGAEAPAWSPWDPQHGRQVAAHFRLLAGAARRSEARPDALFLRVQTDGSSPGMCRPAPDPDPGPHGLHPGWWCGDSLARADFRASMLRKYGSPEALNQAWNSRIGTLEDIQFPRGPQDGRRRWLDFVAWYTHGVTAMADVAAKVARREFPETRLLLPSGPDGFDSAAGADDPLAAKIAARYGAAICSTQGADRSFPDQQSGALGITAAACRFYGAPLWLDASQEKLGIASRVFAALSTGAAGFIGNPALGAPEEHYALSRQLRFGRSNVDVAMLFPTTTHRLRGGRAEPPVFRKGCAEIRDLLNYETLDEPLIQEGALQQYRLLILWEGTIVEAETLARIREWVQAGGVVAAYDFGRIETVEGDRSWFQELFGHAGTLKPPVLERRYAGPSPPSRYRIRTGAERSERFLAGEWQEPETLGGMEGRWTGSVAEARLPVVANRPFRLTLRAVVPAEAAGFRRDVLVNGRRLGLIDSLAPATTISVPAAVVGARALAVVTIQAQTWSPARQIPGSRDERQVGAFITEIQVDPVQGQIAVDPPELPGRIEAGIRADQLRAEWARPVGNGWAVYFPGPRRLLAGYYEMIRFLTYRLSELDPAKPDAPEADNVWDEVYAVRQPDRILYLNLGAQAVTRGTPGVTIPPGGVGAAPLSPPHPELLLQCEKFIEPGPLRPSGGESFSPGRGLTHVLIPPRGRLATRIQIDLPGRYRVFYRAVRRGAPARAEVEIDGRRPAPLELDRSWRADTATLAAGQADLTPGIHTLAIRPLPGQDIRADYVVLTTDTGIGGYAFAPKRAGGAQ